MRQLIFITSKPIVPAEVLELVRSENAGAINLFIGTVRNKTQDKPVIRLEFEAYERMAVKEMTKIANKAKEKWPINEIAIHHRVGALKVSDVPVVIAVSSPHRQQAFEACQFAIDTLKETVPIWKKEVFIDGEEWVSAHP